MQPDEGVTGQVAGVANGTQEGSGIDNDITGGLVVDGDGLLEVGKGLADSEELTGEADGGLDLGPHAHSVLAKALAQQEEGKEPGPVLDDPHELVTAGGGLEVSDDMLQNSHVLLKV